jgi:hypothetical protein
MFIWVGSGAQQTKMLIPPPFYTNCATNVNLAIPTISYAVDSAVHTLNYTAVGVIMEMNISKS